MLVTHDVFVDLNVATAFNEMTKTYWQYCLQRSFHMAQMVQSKTTLCHREGVVMTITQIRFLV